MKLARLHNKGQQTEPIWPVQLAVLVAIGLQLSLNSSLTFGPRYVIPAIELVLLFALAALRPGTRETWQRLRHTIAIVLIALVSVANIVSLVAVIDALFHSSHITGRELIVSGLIIYLTNVIIFGLWYWELDNGERVKRDFLFPQMTAGEDATKQPGWKPYFFDYLYVSVTNATAFSPTDAMPLTRRAKLLMTSQSMISLITIALVAARAVNILS